MYPRDDSLNNMAVNLEISPLQKEHENPMKTFEENLRVSLDKVRGNILSELSNLENKLPLKEFWNKLGSSIQALSKEITKFFVAFCKPPLPTSKETQALVNGFEVVIIAVLSTYSAFNIQEGVILHDVIKTFILDLLKATLDFISSLKNGDKDESLKLVGIVCECCESFSAIPKDTKEVVLREVKSTFELINDAVTEAEEYIRECNESESNDVKEDVNSTCSSETIQQMRHSSLGLAKVAKSLIKKISKTISKNALTDEVDKVNDLDTVAQTVQLLSPSVDELLCCLYSSSMTETSIISEGVAFASLVDKLLQLCRKSHFCLEEDHSWLDFLAKALDHNLKKLKSDEGL